MEGGCMSGRDEKLGMGEVRAWIRRGSGGYGRLPCCGCGGGDGDGGLVEEERKAE